MRTTSLMVALLVAAALAGCTGGTSNEGQLPDEAPDGGSDGSQTRSNSTRGPNGQGGGDNKTYDAYLEVSPDNGTAPLNVTLTFGATWQDNGRRAGQDGNGTGASANQTSTGPASNGTGNQTGGSGNATGNQTGSGGSGNATGNQTGGSGSGNGTRNDGSHPVNRGHDVTWTLEVRLMSGGNATGNGTAQGNATGNQTGNGTSTSTSSTSAGPSGNGTGNGTSQTNTTTGGSGPGNGTGSQTGNGTLVAAFNGTSADLPGNETILLDQTGSYTVTFIVTPDDGSDAIVRDANIAVEPLAPGSPLGNETSTFDGSFVASEPLLCMGSEDFDWVLNSTFGGRDADISQLNVTADVGGLNDFTLTLFAPNETEVASGEEINVEGPFQNGTYVLRAESCVAADVDYTITAIAHYTTPGYVAKGTSEEEGA